MDRLNSGVNVCVMGRILSHAHFKCDITDSLLMLLIVIYQYYSIIYISLSYTGLNVHVTLMSFTRLTLHAIVAHFNTRSGLFLTTTDLHVQVQEHGFRSMTALSGVHRLPAQLVEESPSLFHRSSSPQLVAHPISLLRTIYCIIFIRHCNSISVSVM